MANMIEDNENFAVIDTETNNADEVMSIGIVISNGQYKILKTLYNILYPAAGIYGMYTLQMFMPGTTEVLTDRVTSINNIIELFAKYNVKKIYAYNAIFDFNHLPELHCYKWYDIMRIAAYKGLNPKITDDMEICKTGRLKRNFGVEPIYSMLSGDDDYREAHNAYFDARDEFEIMKLLNKPLNVYDIGYIDPASKTKYIPKPMPDENLTKQRYRNFLGPKSIAKHLFTVDEALEFLNCDENTLRSYIKKWKLQKVIIKGEQYVWKEEATMFKNKEDEKTKLVATVVVLSIIFIIVVVSLLVVFAS